MYVLPPFETPGGRATSDSRAQVVFTIAYEAAV